MADFPSAAFDVSVKAFTWTNRVAAAYKKAPQFSGSHLVISPSHLAGFIGGTLSNTSSKSSSFRDIPGNVREDLTPAIDFFEDFHVVPRSFSLGNILSTTTASIEVYSAFRSTQHFWNTFANNAGAGTTLAGEPSLPTAVVPQHGFVMTLTVSTSGPPTVNTTLDFGFDTGTIKVHIDFNRLVLFDMPPEMPYSELLQFETEVIPHSDQTEQRLAIRRYARQIFDWGIVLDDGSERARLHNKLFDWQSRQWGVPVWIEMTRLTAAASAGASTVTVVTADNADYRIGGLAIVYQDQTTFDVLQVSGVTSTTVTFASPLINSYAINAIVAPCRLGQLEQADGLRYPVNAASMRARFRIVDNVVDLADTSAYPTFNSKVLLVDSNFIRGVLNETWDRPVVTLDSGGGAVYVISGADRSRRSSTKTFLTNTRAGLWNVRRLMHALRGRQVSFYLVTFQKDMEVTANLVSGANTMTIRHIGYTQFAKSRQPQNVIRVVFTDGTTLIRTIIGSSVASSTTETINLSTTWPANFTVAQIARVEYVEKVRLDSDEIRFDYEMGERTSRITAPVKVVLE